MSCGVFLCCVLTVLARNKKKTDLNSFHSTNNFRWFTLVCNIAAIFAI